MDRLSVIFSINNSFINQYWSLFYLWISRICFYYAFVNFKSTVLFFQTAVVFTFSEIWVEFVWSIEVSARAWVKILWLWHINSFALCKFRICFSHRHWALSGFLRRRPLILLCKEAWPITIQIIFKFELLLIFWAQSFNDLLLLYTRFCGIFHLHIGVFLYRRTTASIIAPYFASFFNIPTELLQQQFWFLKLIDFPRRLEGIITIVYTVILKPPCFFQGWQLVSEW